MIAVQAEPKNPRKLPDYKMLLWGIMIPHPIHELYLDSEGLHNPQPLIIARFSVSLFLSIQMPITFR